MKGLFIEVQYDPELAEVEEIDCSGTGRNAYITPPLIHCVLAVLAK